MFIGHFAPALLARAHPEAPSLPVLFVGAQLVDWAFFGFVMAGVEHVRLSPGITAMNDMDLYHMPWTHSLLGACAWAMAFAMVLMRLGAGRNGALIGGGVVMSHWLLDWLVHAPDLTLAGAPPKLGLGLWNYPAVEMPLEAGLIVAGLVVWTRSRRISLLRAGTLGLVLLGLQAFDWFGEKPTEVTLALPILAWTGYAVATLVAWWADRSPPGRNQFAQ